MENKKDSWLTQTVKEYTDVIMAVFFLIILILTVGGTYYLTCYHHVNIFLSVLIAMVAIDIVLATIFLICEIKFSLEERKKI